MIEPAVAALIDGASVGRSARSAGLPPPSSTGAAWSNAPANDTASKGRPVPIASSSSCTVAASRPGATRTTEDRATLGCSRRNSASSAIVRLTTRPGESSAVSRSMTIGSGDSAMTGPGVRLSVSEPSGMATTKG